MSKFHGEDVISSEEFYGFRMVLTKKGKTYYGYLYDLEGGRPVMSGLPIELGTNRREVERYARRWAKGVRKAQAAEAERRAQRAAA